jgi:hypothetical protein
VRIEAIDVKGAAELGAALSKLGVRVVKRSPRPDGHAGERLSRTAAGRIEPAARVGQDALAAGAALRRVSAGGTVFSPGESACWTCLFDRMIRNREIKGFLDRGRRARRRFAARPQPLGQSASSFAAVEIAKAIASGFRTDCAITSSASI